MAIELDKVVTVRFKAADHSAWRDEARKGGLTVSAFIRDAALGVPPVPPRRRLADQDLINQLSRLGNNLNQQTRLLHQLRHRDLLPETAPVLAVLEDVRELLDEVSRSVAEAAR